VKLITRPKGDGHNKGIGIMKEIVSCENQVVKDFSF
jgi:hypothetical protein